MKVNWKNLERRKVHKPVYNRGYYMGTACGLKISSNTANISAKSFWVGVDPKKRCKNCERANGVFV